MIDFNETAAILYPTMAQNAPVTPPIEAKPTTQTPVTKAAEQTATDTGTKPTTGQTSATEQHTDAPSALTLPKDAVIEAGAIERTMAFAKAAGLSPEAAQQALEHANGEVRAYQEHVNNDWTKLTRETWVTESKNDPEVGGRSFRVP